MFQGRLLVSFLSTFLLEIFFEYCIIGRDITDFVRAYLGATSMSGLIMRACLGWERVRVGFKSKSWFVILPLFTWLLSLPGTIWCSGVMPYQLTESQRLLSVEKKRPIRNLPTDLRSVGDIPTYDILSSKSTGRQLAQDGVSDSWFPFPFSATHKGRKIQYLMNNSVKFLINYSSVIGGWFFWKMFQSDECIKIAIWQLSFDNNGRRGARRPKRSHIKVCDIKKSAARYCAA